MQKYSDDPTIHGCVADGQEGGVQEPGGKLFVGLTILRRKSPLSSPVCLHRELRCGGRQKKGLLDDGTAF